jgi:hypothetical protein
MDINRTFSLFPFLPVELQNEIWKDAFDTQQSEGRILCVAPDYMKWTTEGANQPRICIIRSKANPVPIPTLLHACRYTRALALASYDVWPLVDTPLYGRRDIAAALDPESLSKFVYVNKKFDTFFIAGTQHGVWFVDLILEYLSRDEAGRKAITETRIHNFQRLSKIMDETSDEARILFFQQFSKIRNYAFDLSVILYLLKDGSLSSLWRSLDSEKITIIMRHPVFMKPWSTIRKLREIGDCSRKIERHCVHEILQLVDIDRQCDDYHRARFYRYQSNHSFNPMVSVMTADGSDCPLVAGAHFFAERTDRDHDLLDLIFEVSHALMPAILVTCKIFSNIKVGKKTFIRLGSQPQSHR